MHTRIDALTHHHFWSLLPSSVFDRVVIIVSICDTLMPLNTPLHPMSVTSITLCTVFTGLSSFQLVPMSTVPSVKGLHLQKRIATGVTHHPPAWHTSQFLASQLIANGPNHGKYCTLVKTQICKCVVRQEEASHMLLYQESWQVGLRRRILGKTQTCRPCTHPTALGYSECCTLLSLCALSHRKLKPSMSEDVHLLQETLNSVP